MSSFVKHTGLIFFNTIPFIKSLYAFWYASILSKICTETNLWKFKLISWCHSLKNNEKYIQKMHSYAECLFREVKNSVEKLLDLLY